MCPFIRFTWKNQAFEFRILPFGLSLAPWVFNRVVRELVIAVKRKGFRMHAYLDNWLVLAQSKKMSHTHSMSCNWLSLGFHINLLNLGLIPSQEFSFLGMSVDTTLGLVLPSTPRILKFKGLLDHVRSLPSVEVLTVASILESLAPLVPLGRLFKHPNSG